MRWEGEGVTVGMPLAKLVVLDLASGSAAVVGRDLAQLGARVMRVEPKGGHPDRAAFPRVAGASVDFAVRDAGKDHVELDLGDDLDRVRLEALIDAADILIESTRPGSPENALLDAPAILERHPRLVILSISDFGQAGAWRHWQATTPVLDALTGELARSGIPGRAPLLPPGDLGTECALVQAGYVGLLAYANRLKTGKGEHVDFSLLRGAAQALDPGFGISGSATAGRPPSLGPRGRPDARFMYPILPCADCYVRICILAVRQWRGMFGWMGSPAEFADPAFDDLSTRFKSPTLLGSIAAFFADKTKLALETEGQRAGVPTAAVFELDEALASDQMIARAAFVPGVVADGVTAPFPNGVMEIDGVRAGYRPGRASAEAVVAGSPPPDPWRWQGERPLSGIRVLDLGVIVVGADQSRLLADQGAEVIKIENKAFPDGTRQNRDGKPVSLSFAAGHRNKLGLGLNLRMEEGRALFLELVRHSDVVMTNFKPGTMESLGLGYEVLSAVNPGVILTDSSAFGPTGPWAKRMGYGPLVRASAGLTAQWRYPDDPASFSDAVTIYPDHVAARIVAMGTLALLIRRLTTGRGGTVSTSQAEIMLSHQATVIAARALSAHKGFEAQSDHDAPWGVFPAMGDDEWCVVTVRDDRDWQAFCGAIERPDLGEDQGLATRMGRDAARARIDAALVAWLASRTPHDAMTLFQSAGVPAAAMLRVFEVPDFPPCREQALFAEARHPIHDRPFWLETGPARFTRIADPTVAPAPVMGEHTIQIARDLLGLSEPEIDRLIDSGVLEPATAETLALVGKQGR